MLAKDQGSTLEPPDVVYVARFRQWILRKAYAFGYGAHRITIPAGFVFDLASIPRFLWWRIAPFELSETAPLLHDFLYRYRGSLPAGCIEPPRTFTRKESDQVFRDVMELEGVCSDDRAIGYWGVRLFGWWPWHRVLDRLIRFLHLGG